MKYEVEISESTEKSLAKIPKKDRFKILEKIDALEEDPMPAGSIKLKGYKEALYRIRSGDYRFIYSILIPVESWDFGQLESSRGLKILSHMIL